MILHTLLKETENTSVLICTIYSFLYPIIFKQSLSLEVMHNW